MKAHSEDSSPGKFLAKWEPQSECFPWGRLNIDLCRDAELVLTARDQINPLNAELNPICHLLVLLGDLMFMARAS
jgi:hypothetical protein